MQWTLEEPLPKSLEGHTDCAELDVLLGRDLVSTTSLSWPRLAARSALLRTCDFCRSFSIRFWKVSAWSSKWSRCPDAPNTGNWCCTLCSRLRWSASVSLAGVHGADTVPLLAVCEDLNPRQVQILCFHWGLGLFMSQNSHHSHKDQPCPIRKFCQMWVMWRKVM